MALFRIQIKLKSPLVTPLKGDTIWGHVAWGIANHEGDDAVARFIADCKENHAFVISSAFPKGSVCKAIPDVPERIENLSPEDYAKIKQAKKKRYESANAYFDISEPVQKTEEKSPFKSNTVTHNTISRITNSVVDGGLYSIDELWTDKEHSDFDIYVLSSYSAERVKQLCEWAFENGYGADSSTGKGEIEVGKNVTEVKPKLHGNKYVALAPFVVPDMDENEIEKLKLKADIFVRSGKIGGSFVSSLSPYKKTVVLYEEGAVFESNEPIEFIGELLTNVHADSHIVQSAFAPVIPIC